MCQTVSLGHGVYIERVSEFRFLGVIMDDKLIWKAPIAHLKTKVSKNFSKMVRLQGNVCTVHLLNHILATLGTVGHEQYKAIVYITEKSSKNYS